MTLRLIHILALIAGFLIFTFIFYDYYTPIREVLGASLQIPYAILIALFCLIIGYAAARLRKASEPIRRLIRYGGPSSIIGASIILIYFDSSLFVRSYLVWFTLFLCIIPAVVAYSLWTRNRILLQRFGIGLFAVYGLLALLFGLQSFLTNQWLSIVFFLCYILFLELTDGLLYYSDAAEKMKAHAILNSGLITRFHKVLTGYMKILAVSLILGLLISVAIIMLTDSLASQTTTELGGITIGSVASICAFVSLLILSLLCFWLVSPSREKNGWRPRKWLPTAILAEKSEEIHPDREAKR